MEHLEEFKEIMGFMDDLFLQLCTQGASQYQRDMMGGIMDDLSRKRAEMERTSSDNTNTDSTKPPYCCKKSVRQ